MTKTTRNVGLSALALAALAAVAALRPDASTEQIPAAKAEAFCQEQCAKAGAGESWGHVTNYDVLQMCQCAERDPLANADAGELVILPPGGCARMQGQYAESCREWGE